MVRQSWSGVWRREGQVGQIGEARLLAMTALIIADRSAGSSSSAVDTGQDAEAAASALEKAAVRLTELASKLTTP